MLSETEPPASRVAAKAFLVTGISRGAALTNNTGKSGKSGDGHDVIDEARGNAVGGQSFWFLLPKGRNVPIRNNESVNNRTRLFGAELEFPRIEQGSVKVEVPPGRDVFARDDG